MDESAWDPLVGAPAIKNKTPWYKSKLFWGIIALFVVSLIIIISVVSAFSVKTIQKHQQQEDFVSQIFLDKLMFHLIKFQEIAEQNNGSRTAITGYEASTDYIVETLQQQTKYHVEKQEFTYAFYQELSPPQFSFVQPSATEMKWKIDFQGLRYGATGNVTARVDDVGGACSMTDFANFTRGRVAIIARGELKDCLMPVKIANAKEAGASAVLISYDPGTTGLFSAGLETLAPFPCFTVTYDVGMRIRELIPQTLTVSMSANTIAPYVKTHNVLAYTVKGDFPMIVVGSHLDSVPAGPGINDNGSGSSTNLELAIELYKSNIDVESKVMFAWWAAEEFGLLGSKYYVRNLTDAQKGNIALYLNFDMLGSPNFHRGVYQGSTAPNETIRTASTKIQGLFEKYFTTNSLGYDLVEFNLRSDFAPFIESGIPCGALATGAEGVKNAEGRRKYGGWANVAYDPCYHQACDTVENINQPALEQMAKAAASTLGALVMEEHLTKYLNS